MVRREILAFVRTKEVSRYITDAVVVGRRLYGLRIAADMTQNDVAIALQMRRPSVSDIEHGRRFPSYVEIVGFAALYQVSIVHLFVAGV